jgi:hypothetical protein
VVLHPRREAEPSILRLFPDRIAGRWKGRRVERAYGHTADRGVAIPFPIERAAAIRAEMKSDAIAAVGTAFVDFPLAIEPHPMFGITRTEMESGAGVALARLAVAQVDPIGLTRGDDAKRAAVATPGSFHRSSPILVWPHFDQFCGLPSSRYEQKGRCRVDQESAAEANRVRSARPWILGDSLQMSFAATL